MRRLFVFIFLLKTLTLNSQQLEEFRAVKLTNVDSNVLFTDANISDAMNFLASNNINVILPVVWNGGWTLYPSKIMDSLFSKKIHPNFTNRDPLERLIIEAHRVGIEVYPWFEYGFAAWYSGGEAPFGGHILQKFPDWACRDQQGKIVTENGFDWMSAINPESQRFISSLVKEVIENYDVDGIEFSDRIPAMPVKGGYESYSVELYKAEHSGQNPPTNIHDLNWKRWRADKLNEWYRDIKNLIKSYSQNLFVSSSPSVYPWGYDNYLQDAKTWIDSDIADHFIPQLYRYDFQSYLYELNSAINLVSSKKEKLVAGILMNLGVGSNEYVISSDYLLNAIKANRDRGVNGEAFFYYEGFRKNNNKLADTLKSTFYAEPAIVPIRGGNPYRPKAIIVNEDGAEKIGNWESYSMKGFEGKILRTSNNGFAEIKYYALINDEAFYDIFIYATPNTNFTDSAHYTFYDGIYEKDVIFNQRILSKTGWQKIGTAYLSKGENLVLKLDNSFVSDNEYLSADAIMIILNRKLSPDIVVKNSDIQNNSIFSDFNLSQNYPNPFNPSTIIEYTVPQYLNDLNVQLKVYDLIGQEIATLVDERKSAGKYRIEFNASELTSGIYFYTLKSGKYFTSRKMILLK